MKNRILRMTYNDGTFFHCFFRCFFPLVPCAILFLALRASAQPIPIATIRPDVAAPGMNVVIEILTVNDGLSSFGPDEWDSKSQIALLHPQDSNRIVFAPIEVSWNGKMLQLPAYVLPNAAPGVVPFLIQSSITGRLSDTLFFTIVPTQHLGVITGNATIGAGFGTLSPGNTLVVDSLVATNATIRFSTAKSDTLPGNPRLQPVVILSKGPVRLTNTTISVNANHLNGGPGGGGGGHGFPGAGGEGFTGGGSCPSDSLSNNGSDSAETLFAGGKAATGIVGGGSDPNDQGGGGGTGAPYGVSGAAGLGGQVNSPPGGYGGGSGGGEENQPLSNLEYGGGGGGFGTNGAGGGQSLGIGANGGDTNDGRFLVPLAGGSGGGAGNSYSVDENTQGGSGGGGGGALEIVAFDSIIYNSTTLSAQGDSGTSGAVIAGGGGGGSGGSIYLATPIGIRALNTTINVSGGAGGQGALDGFPGGAGGFGRVRIDAANNLNMGTLATVWVNGIAFTPNNNTAIHGLIQISGVAQDTLNTEDTIRIFYRTQHSDWQFADTVRAADGSWSKWIPSLHDSLLFVGAMVATRNPDTQRNNYEPSWLLSDAGLAVLHTPTSPYLVTVDTLTFDSTQVGQCKTRALVIKNEGEALLVVKNGGFTGSQAFSMGADSEITIAPLSQDTLEVTFCPDSMGASTATLSIVSNDSQQSPRTVVLLGFGIVLHDSLQIIPSRLSFDRVLLGQCATDTVLLKSVGHDPTYLDNHVWNVPPFSLRLMPPDTILDSGETRELLVTFCPQDTGDVRIAPILGARRDSLSIVGRGVLRLAASVPSIDAGIVCFGHPATTLDIISNLGNDTISILSLRGNHIPHYPIHLLLLPQASDTLPILIPADTLGTFTDSIAITIAGDTLYTTLRYRVTAAALSIPPEVAFDFVCVNNDKIDTVPISNTGSDTLRLSYSGPPPGRPFSLLDSITILPPGTTDSLRLQFHPDQTDTAEQRDSILLRVSVGGCDSIYTLRLLGAGHDSLGVEALDFGTVLIGACTDSFLVVGNPCGPETSLDSVQNSNSDFRVLSKLPATILPNGNIHLLVQFCPSDASVESDTAVIEFGNGKTLRASLIGAGVKITNPWAHFTLSNSTVTMGDTAITTLTFDSSSLHGTHRISATLTFDPTVLSPTNSYPLANTIHGVDSLTFSGMLDFNSAPSQPQHISWLTLAGPSNSSAIRLTVTTDTLLNVIVVPGSVSLTDCNNLAGRLAAGGIYAISTITPNPASEKAAITVQLGNDGYVEAGIYDMTGRLVQDVLKQSFKRGTYQLIIPTTSIASGRYLLEINSMGWQASAPLVVER